MLIHCPKCMAAYEINEALIPEKGKKMRCSNCAEVFTALPADLQNRPEKVEPEEVLPATDVPEEMGDADESSNVEEISTGEAEQGTDDVVNATEEVAKPEDDNPMDDIFKRLSQQTEGLFKAENELSHWQRFVLKFKKVVGFHSQVFRKALAGVSVVLLLLCCYSYRFEIVRQLPFLHYVYGAFGIQSVVPGEGLEFENIVWDMFEEDYVRKLAIKGFIVNSKERDIDLPVIHVEMLDSDVQMLQVLNQTPDVVKLPAGGRLAVNLVVNKPSPLTKYIYLTFIARDK